MFAQTYRPLGDARTIGEDTDGYGTRPGEEILINYPDPLFTR